MYSVYMARDHETCISRRTIFKRKNSSVRNLDVPDGYEYQSSQERYKVTTHRHTHKERDVNTSRTKSGRSQGPHSHSIQYLIGRIFVTSLRFTTHASLRRTGKRYTTAGGPSLRPRTHAVYSGKKTNKASFFSIFRSIPIHARAKQASTSSATAFTHSVCTQPPSDIRKVLSVCDY